MPSKEINSDVKALIERFLEQKIYTDELFDKLDLLGVLVYGSSLTGYASKESDIDLLVVTITGDKVTRGVCQFEGRKIEYFIKPIERFFSESQKFADMNCPSHLALQQNAYILFDRGGFMENVLKTDVEYYNKNRKPPKFDKVVKFVQIENRIASLKNILSRNGKEFHAVYYNILELIRVFHSTTKEEADVPFAKAYRVYNDKNYYNRFVGANANNPLPDKEFVRLYSKCVEMHNEPKVMLNNLLELFNYEKQFVSIDPNNYQLKY